MTFVPNREGKYGKQNQFSVLLKLHTLTSQCGGKPSLGNNVLAIHGL